MRRLAGVGAILVVFAFVAAGVFRQLVLAGKQQGDPTVFQHITRQPGLWIGIATSFLVLAIALYLVVVSLDTPPVTTAAGYVAVAFLLFESMLAFGLLRLLSQLSSDRSYPASVAYSAVSSAVFDAAFVAWNWYVGLISWQAWRQRTLPRWLAYLGLATAAAWLLRIVFAQVLQLPVRLPAQSPGADVFEPINALLLIVWFISLGVLLLAGRAPTRA